MITFNAVISKIVVKNVDNVETIQKKNPNGHWCKFIKRGKKILFTIWKAWVSYGKNYGSVDLERKKLHQKSQNDGTRTYKVYF